MSQYLTLTEFRSRSLMPSSDIDRLEDQEPGWIDQLLADWSDWIDARLRKRYAAPFDPEVPVAVRRWLARLCTPRCYLKLGINPLDQQSETIQEDYNDARAEIKEAADSEEGLFDLPLKEEADAASGIVKGGPYAYSEQSPYVWADRQVQTGRSEDQNRTGTRYG